MKIGIISDTHSTYKEEWISVMKNCDVLLHAGDIGDQETFEWFQNLGMPVYMVKGNCDKGAWAEYLPESMKVPLQGRLFYLVHNRAYLPLDLQEIDYIIYGHTHIRNDEKRGDLRLINPGSAGINRGTGKTMAILNLENDDEKLEYINI